MSTASERPVGAADRRVRPPGLPVPMRWPPAWRHLWPAVARRAVFAGTTMALTAVGLLVAGDVDAQWWLPLLPAVLLAGTAGRPGRVRRTLQRAARRGRLRCLAGSVLPESRPGAGPRFVPRSGRGHLDAVPLPPGRAATLLAERRGGQPALLVWDERAAAAAVVLDDLGVGYLEAAPARRTAAGASPPLSAARAYPI
jgi:hypothetical protein